MREPIKMNAIKDALETGGPLFLDELQDCMREVGMYPKFGRYILMRRYGIYSFRMRSMTQRRHAGASEFRMFWLPGQEWVAWERIVERFGEPFSARKHSILCALGLVREYRLMMQKRWQKWRRQKWRSERG